MSAINVRQCEQRVISWSSLRCSLCVTQLCTRGPFHGLQSKHSSTPIRLQFDRATTIWRPTFWPYGVTGIRL